jgi:pimeloyl-ACP methyl ester carboxylesterase
MPRLNFCLFAGLVGLGVAAVATVAAPATQPLPAGKGSFQFLHGRETLEVHTYKPASYQGGPILFVIHGQGRNADGYRDYGIPLAERHGALVIAPQLDATRYPGERFQRGGVLRSGKLAPREEWTYAVIPALADLVRRLEGRPDLPYSLIGHSAGGQFAIRLAAMMPGQAQRIVAANPGSLLFPTRGARWGYGFGGLPPELASDEVLRAFLAAPFTLLLGTSDTGREDADLDRSEPAMAQGPHRFARGHACFQAAQTLARQRGWTFNWKLLEVAGTGHSGKDMIGSSQASAALFGPRP